MRFVFLLTIASFLFSSCSKNDSSPTPPPDPLLHPAVDTLSAGWQGKKIDTSGRVLNDIFFADATTGFACGERKAFFKTIDGGTNWQPIIISSGNGYINLQFLNTQNGFMACGEGILRTPDGGNTWQLAPIGYKVDVFFPSLATGFCTSQNGLMKSVDSGKTWISVSPNYRNLSSLWFLNNTKGFISSKDSGLLKTLDGGATLTTVINVRLDGYLPVYFTNATNGCTGIGREIYVTNDGGDTWSLLKHFLQPVRDVKNVGPNEYYVLTGNEIWHTSDGGANWAREVKIIENEFAELTLTQPGHVWAAATGGKLYYK